MKEVLIESLTGELSATVLPDYGGMLAKLFYRDTPVFHLDGDMLPNSNVLAGGNPILFPFPSRTADDAYELDGTRYSMPFHGLVKYSQFGVGEVKKDSVTLYVESSEVSKKENYPFDYRLEVTYSLRQNSAYFTSTIHNLSATPLPHYFGWHPYFTATDKARFVLRPQMERYTDYADGKAWPNTGSADLTKPGNYIYEGRTGTQTEIENPADGYRARILTDDSFDVLVVCTSFDGTVCVEPWMGLPNSINSGKYVRWVQPGESVSNEMVIEVSQCGETGARK